MKHKVAAYCFSSLKMQLYFVRNLTYLTFLLSKKPQCSPSLLFLHLWLPVQAQRRSREHPRSASAVSLSGGDEKSDHSEAADQHLSYYSNGGFFPTTATGKNINSFPSNIYEGATNYWKWLTE